MRVWRCVHDAFLSEAWAGEGAARHGGRFNRVGDPMVYTSAEAALAVLEVLAGNVTSMDLVDWRLLAADLPDDAVREAPRGDPVEAGRAFLRSGALAMRVPSVIVPGVNVLLNPASPAWDQVHVRPETPLDPRLWR